MRAIIPVAGFGSRMRPHTHTQPKVLLQVAGKPMLDHIIDSLVEAGITGVTLVIGHLGARIEEHVRKHYGHLDLHFIEQTELLGLGHAIWLTREVHRNDERLLIILGDTIVRADFRALFAMRGSALGVKAVEDPRRFGVVELTEDRITRVIEKASNPPTNLAIVGVYLIDKPALLFEGLDHLVANDIRTKNEYQLTDALQYMIDRDSEFRTFNIDAWLDCGKPETLLDTNRRLLEILSTEELIATYRQQFPRAVIVPPVFIGEGCHIEHSVVGPYASIARQARVEGSILRDCTMGKGAVIRNMHLESSMIGEFAEVSGVGLSINIGDHSVIMMK